MRKSIRRAVSMAAALAMSVSFITGTGFTGTAQSVSYDYSDDKLVPVIVSVNGSTVIENASYNWKEYLSSGEAASNSESAVSLQRKVQDYIRGYYPELEVGYSYSILLNGFSCEIPESLIDVVKDYPLVSGVSINASVQIPDMASASELAGINTFRNDTGITGEGQVIAVIDSELDVTNDMFAPIDDKNNALSKERISEIASGVGFCVDVDPERAYVSSKLPYVIDYIDDPYEGVADLEEYHGTHVAGIAAGNEITTEDGITISGVAKDAQIVFMACNAGDGTFNMSAVAAALEDAVKLGADVVNLSLGITAAEIFDKQDDPLAMMIDTAEEAGIIICKSAGNEGNTGFESSIPFVASNPDTNMLGDFCEGRKTLIVASADNDFEMKCHLIDYNGTLMNYTECFNDESLERIGFMNEFLTEPSYEYEYCGKGDLADVEGKDLNGKIALVDRGEYTFAEKAENVLAAGAVGVIVVNYKDSHYQSVYTNSIPVCMVSFEDGEILKNAENKTIAFSDGETTVKYDTCVSDFTSWGTKESLELRPDIMGIGGNVLSAGYSNGYNLMSGTSMSSPFVAGCVTVMKQNISASKPELSDDEKADFIRNVMMNTAVPYTNDGVYVQPRRQGAGLVQLDKALADKVVLTNENGYAKVSLYDQIGDTFDFNICIDNFSDEDVSFTGAKLVLTADGYKFDEELEDYVIDGQIVLDSSCDLSGLMNTAAGEKKTENIRVSMNSAQLSSIDEIYVNGFFIEGYLVLEGANNCSDISVPVLGFRGDWAAVPAVGSIENAADEMLTTPVGAVSLKAGVPVLQFTEIINEIFENIPDEEFDAAETDEDMAALLFSYGTDEQLTRLGVLGGEEYMISPDDDGLADNIGKTGLMLRSAYSYGADIYNEAGELVIKGYEENLQKGRVVTFQADGSLSDLPDGKYTAETRLKINYDRSENNIQTDSFEFTVDKKDPEIKTEINEVNGRTILSVTASDENLDGVFVVGKGEAARVDSEKKNEKNVSYALNMTLSALESEGGFYSGDMYMYDTFFTKMLTGIASEEEAVEYTFSDVVVPENDADTVTVQYDITGLSEYEVAVMDKAFNLTEYEGESVPAESVSNGIWESDKGIMYVFENENFTVKSKTDGSVLTGKYTLKEGNAVFIINGTSEENSAFISVKGDDLVISWDDGTKERIRFVKEGTAADLSFRYAAGYVDAVLADYNDRYAALGMPEPERYEIVCGEGSSAMVIIYSTYNGSELIMNYYALNLETGGAVDAAGTELFLEYKGEEAPEVPEVTEPAVTTEASVTETEPAVTTTEAAPVTTEAEPVTTTVSSSSEKRYSDKELCDMALEDYEQKNGVRPSDAKVIDNGDGTVSIVLGDLDVYTVDPVTGKGTDSSGKTVDLPQTGMTSPAAAIAVLSAAAMISAGAVLVSGSRRRKEEK